LNVSLSYLLFKWQEERGFKWWAGNLAQSITVEESKIYLGSDVYKLQARTGVLKDIHPDQKFYNLIAEMMRFSTLSGLTFNPDDKSRLEMVTTMWVHDDNRPPLRIFLCNECYYTKCRGTHNS